MEQTATGTVIRTTDRVKQALSVEMLACIAAGAAAAYFTTASLLLHFSFHSYGWDLGIFDQVLWNTAHGHPFAYSFRGYIYLGDHFQPILLFLTPLAYLEAGPAPLLAVQGIAFGSAVVPLYLAARRLAGTVAPWFAIGAYVFGLAQARAVTYDFHPECFAPLLAFTALWALASERPRWFIASALAMMLLKEDMVLLVLGMCWVAWLGFGQVRAARVTAGSAAVYALVVSAIVMPLIIGSDSNPMRERYAYLGDNAAEMAWTALTHPNVVIDHLWARSSLDATFLLLAGAGFLPLLAPRLLPPLALLLLEPFLAEHGAQQNLHLHYMVVPAAFAMVLAVMALRSPPWEKVPALITHRNQAIAVAGAAMLAGALIVFARESPLPPSFQADTGRFNVDEHSRTAADMVSMVPGGVPASAQATYVPHLSQRRHIYEFPRVLDSQWVLLDTQREIPGYDFPGFQDCLDELPRLGFRLVREVDGITLWHREDIGAQPDHCG